MDRYDVPVGPAAVNGPRHRFRNPAGPVLVARCPIAASALAEAYAVPTGPAARLADGNAALPPPRGRPVVRVPSAGAGT
ncbi:hypothetical protein GCM10010275_34380 [Streptomyces litmocidini]|uniref:hypothetical protein n=1 Tax=Streptomyces litmocidini TaxID=67318 RepID=UPI00167D809E|nr:hypothetical protein [Streptomyces litmocidini]GGU94117.1 hypothetical protein GCM10010275_34380 [Streptomyces litmocidini]